MSVLGHRVVALPRAVQPALSLGHAEVRWDALPPAVQDEVLARWCELLDAVITGPITSMKRDHDVTGEETGP